MRSLLKNIIFFILLLIVSTTPTLAQNWQMYYDSTKYYSDREQYKNSLMFGDLALKAAEKEFGKVNQNYQKTLTLLAEINFYTDNLEKAIELARQDSSISYALYGINHTDYVRSNFTIGQLYKEGGLYSVAEGKIKNVIEIQKGIKGERDSAYAFMLTYLGQLYVQTGRYDLSNLLYSKAITIQKELLGVKNPDYGMTLHNVGELYKLLGKYEEAEPLYQQALEIDKETMGSENADYAISLKQIADLYRQMGRYDEAEPLLKQALEILKNKFGENSNNYSMSLVTLGILYQNMGRYESAEILYNDALAIQKKLSVGEYNSNYAVCLNNLATLYEAMEEYSKAEPLHKQTLKIYSKQLGEDHSFYATSLDNLARLFRKMGRLNDADSLFKRALAIRKTTLKENHPEYAKSLQNIADLYLTMGRYEEAEEFYKKALELRSKILGENHPDYASTLYNLAVLYKVMGRYADAEPLFAKSLDKYIEQVKRYFPYLSEKEKQQFWSSVKNKFEMFNGFAVEYSAKKPEILSKMYNYNLVTKGLILSSTKKVLSKIRQSDDTALVALLDKWQATKEFWLYLFSNPDEAKKKSIKIDSIAEIANDLEKKLSSSSDEFKKVFSAGALTTWENVKSNLRKNEAAVEIIRYRINHKDWTDSVSYAALVISGKTKKHPLLSLNSNGNDLETKYIKLYSNLVKILKILPSGMHSDIEENVVDDDLYALYQNFWAKIQKNLKGISKVYLSLDGVYNSLNLMTLKNPETQHYLAEEKDIVIVTNTKDIIEYRSRPPLEGKNDAVIIGNPKYDFNLKNDDDYNCCIPPLPGTQVECERLTAELRNADWKVTTYLKEEALEEKVKAVKSPRLLHIATHGFFEPDVEDKGAQLGSETKDYQNPLLRSMLIFAGAENESGKKNTDNGLLTAYEAMNLSLDNTEIVVLSACETGLGEVKNGEGVYGLQRAFQVAGTRALIMSLWTVNDEATQMLMTKFYEHFLSGEDKRTAFRNAQLQLKSAFPQFYYWGAFVMVGE